MQDKNINNSHTDINSEESNFSADNRDEFLLESLLESISLECVLADTSDPDSFETLLSLLKNFFHTAKELGYSELAEDAKKAGKIVKNLSGEPERESRDGSSYSVSSDNSEVENLLESLNLIVSEMKSFLHFIARSPAGSPSENQSENQSENKSEGKSKNKTEDQAAPSIKREETPGESEKTDQREKKAEKTKASYEERVEVKVEDQSASSSPTSDLIHPGELPSFLNIEDFAEFLSLQKNTLDRMEVLILDIEKSNNIEHSLGELKRLFHTTKGEAGFLGLKDVESVCHKAEDLMVSGDCGNITDILLGVKDWLEATYRIYSGKPGSAPSKKEVLALFESSVKPQAASIASEKSGVKLSDSSPKGKLESDSHANAKPSNDRPDSAGERKDDERNSEELPQSRSISQFISESINVDAARLDRMVNIIGELAIAESMVTQSRELTSIASNNLLRSLSSLHKITKELQTLGLSLRMVPLRSLFHRMDRVTRDLARKTGKKIRFIIKGEATELDKTLVDKLGDPLIHLIRNSVDHGIEENGDIRISKGKDEIATIELRAFHKGGNLFIEVEDDGRGVDRKKLKEKAMSQGVITDFEQFDDEDLLNLVFHQGLSTAGRVTDVSGRGVGMDVVKKSIESCRGKVSITSVEGQNTVCTIKIPLTLSIIDGLVVRVAKELYVVPTLSVVTSIKIEDQSISHVFGKGEMINVLGRLIPVFRLERLFNLEKKIDDTGSGIVVVIEESDKRVAIPVDELVGKQSTVIKNLGMGMEEIEGIAGGTIMPDGRVSLILDVPGIIELASKS